MQVFTQFDATLSALWDSILTREREPWPFYTYAWHAAWHRHFGGGEQLAVVINEEQTVLVPLAMRDGVAHFSGGEEFADYLDAIGDPSAKAGVWNGVLSLLATRGASSLLLRNIPETSATIDAFRLLSGAAVTREDSVPRLALPRDFDQYTASLPRKQRHELKRKMKRFEETYADARIGVLEHPDMELLLRLMRHNADKAAFLTPPMEAFFRDLPNAAGAALMQHTLTVAGQPAATVVSFRTGSGILLYNSGYDPAYEGSGWYLKAALVRWAVEHGYAEVNFLQGSERYKYDLGAADTAVYRVELPLSGAAVR